MQVTKAERQSVKRKRIKKQNGTMTMMMIGGGGGAEIEDVRGRRLKRAEDNSNRFDGSIAFKGT